MDGDDEACPGVCGITTGLGIGSFAGLMFALSQSKTDLGFRFLLLFGAMIALRKAQLPVAATYLVACAPVTATVAAAAGWYDIDGLDTVMHTAVPGAIVVGAWPITSRLRHAGGERPETALSFQGLVAGCLGVLAGCIWEVYEWLAVNVFGQGTITIDAADTVEDLVATVIGSALAAVALFVTTRSACNRTSRVRAGAWWLVVGRQEDSDTGTVMDWEFENEDNAAYGRRPLTANGSGR